MDLAFTPEEQTFREEIRAWVGANLPAELSHKVHNALRLSRDDLQRWAKSSAKRLVRPRLAQGIRRPRLDRGAKTPV